MVLVSFTFFQQGLELKIGEYDKRIIKEIIGFIIVILFRTFIHRSDIYVMVFAVYIIELFCDL